MARVVAGSRCRPSNSARPDPHPDLASQPQRTRRCGLEPCARCGPTPHEGSSGSLSVQGPGTFDSHDLQALLTEREAASFLNFSSRTLQAWRQNGRGPFFVKVSKRCVRYKRADLLAWIDDRRTTSTSEDEVHSPSPRGIENGRGKRLGGGRANQRNGLRPAVERPGDGQK